jgi:adenosylhomocysteinase
MCVNVYADVVTDARATAEQLIRRFARETNLMIAGRPVRIVGEDALAGALRVLVRDLGALPGSPGAVGDLVFAPGAEHDILLDGAALVARGDAGGRVDFAGVHMPLSRARAARLAADGTVRGLRIGIAMVLEPKTAQLALMLRDAGADVSVYAHPDEIDIAVADVLRRRGVPVDGDPDRAGAAERDAAIAFLRRGHDILLDDGSHLIRLAHEAGTVDELIGAAEETTSGIAPLRRMRADGELRIPVVAVNDAPMKTSFDNRYGTGQSCVFAVADVLDSLGVAVRDQPAVVVGYGPVGEGVAAHLAALGAEVAVAETDPVRALRAAHDGHRIGLLDDLTRGALVVSATGAPHTIGEEVLRKARIVAVAGGVPGEVDIDERMLRPETDAAGEPLAHVERHGDEGALVIDRGACVNLSAGEGNPIEIMDLSFAVQLAAVELLVREPLEPGLHRLPASVDDELARSALAVRGMQIDSRGVSQTVAEADWRSRRYTGARGAA